eukprot:TRINITY_DN4295_c0_g1_i4.p1 TRINITY_DN4295_c0_g1~~TRINITY_DN4295_c0_g1_i4.p1  ORF type:complete len:352 (+),score=100.43 TRINITY_DN4295_c0_g1_i4:85-1140(+)
MEKLNPEEELLLNPSNNSATESTTTATTHAATPTPTPAQQPASAPTGQKAKAKAAFGGLMNWVSRVAEDVTKEVERGIDSLQESIEKEVHQRNADGERDFWKLFNLPETERLLGVFGCRVLSGTEGLAGAAYLSVGYFCFNGSDLKIVIPLPTILKVQKALRVRSDARVESIGPKYQFQPVPSTARGDCVMLYTNDNMIHHFFSDPLTFGPMHNVVLSFETFFKMVDETWKARTYGTYAPASYQPQSAHESGYPSPLPTQQPPAGDQQQQQQSVPPQQQHQQQPMQFVPYPAQGYAYPSAQPTPLDAQQQQPSAPYPQLYPQTPVQQQPPSQPLPPPQQAEPPKESVTNKQ